MAKPPKSGTDRKADQRNRDRTQGVKRIELRLSPELAEHLDKACRIRGGEGRTPYTSAEYLELLIQLDKQRFDAHIEQLKRLKPCGKCGEKLPGGCGGAHRGEDGCWHSIEYRQLLLTEPTRMAPMTEREIDQLLGVY